MIFDQSGGICDQGNKPKHVILPNFNKSRKCLSFEKVRERKSTTSSVIIQFGGILCIGFGSAGQLFHTNIAKKQRNLVTNVVLVFQFHLNLYSIYLRRSNKLF